MAEMSNGLTDKAQSILRNNDCGGYTVPTSGLYPFQWNWDSCLVALGWSTFNKDRAWQEIESLFEAQWSNGTVPHIVFHKDDAGYFPGPEVWRAGDAIASSGITQPPVAASCVRRLLDGDPVGVDRARRLFPKLCAWHRWFHRERDPEGTGLVTTIHPWETGMDNSPAWDEALTAFAVHPELEPYERRDTSHIDSAQRPSDRDYDRYMTLVQIFREYGYGAEAVQHSPFRIADIATNAILLRADRDLLLVARELGEPTTQIEGWIARSERAFARLIEPRSGELRSYDQVRERHLPTTTHAAFLAFWGNAAPLGLDSHLGQWLAGAKFAVSSMRPDDPAFDRYRYWRGPVWAITNFMIAEGVPEFGRKDLADRNLDDTNALISLSGFFEYFDPLDGRGLGGDEFSWTAAMWLYWAHSRASE